MSDTPIRDRRRKAARRFYAKFALLSLFIILVAWAAWFAPWSRQRHPAPVEITR